MDRELTPDNIRDLWQNQSTEPVQMSLEEIRQKAKKFQIKMRNRNLREYVSAGFVFVAFVYFWWRFPGMRLGSSLILAGVAYAIYHLHSKGAAKIVPESLALSACIEFHRRELERQRDLARDVWKWYLLPLVPGAFTVFAVPVLQSPPEQWVRAWPLILFPAGVFYLAWKLNKRGADKLQRQIDELNSMNRV